MRVQLIAADISYGWVRKQLTAENVIAECSTIWQLRISVIAECSTVWQLRISVIADWEYNWQLRISVIDECSTIWQLRISVIADWEYNWQLRISVIDECSTIWQLGISVIADWEYNWQLRISVIVPCLYNLSAKAITAECMYYWQLKISVIADSVCNWQLRISVICSVLVQLDSWGCLLMLWLSACKADSWGYLLWLRLCKLRVTHGDICYGWKSWRSWHTYGESDGLVVERFRSVCQNRRWQITGKHTCLRRMWLRIKLHGKLVHGCMVYLELAPRRQQFHVAPAMWPLWRIFRKRCVKLTHSESHTTRAQGVSSETENSVMPLGLISRWGGYRCSYYI